MVATTEETRAKAPASPQGVFDSSEWIPHVGFVLTVFDWKLVPQFAFRSNFAGSCRTVLNIALGPITLVIGWANRKAIAEAKAAIEAARASNIALSKLLDTVQ